jgi:hypothetical protein
VPDLGDLVVAKHDLFTSPTVRARRRRWPLVGRVCLNFGSSKIFVTGDRFKADGGDNTVVRRDAAMCRMS